MQILVVVILAVFYAVGSIVKAKANKTALKEEKQIPRKPARKPPEGARELFKQPQRPARPTPRSQPRPQVQVQPPRKKVARPQPAGRKLPTKTGEAIELPTFATLRSTLRSTRYLSEILSDYDDPDMKY